MKSSKCAACGFVSFSEGENCKSCGADLSQKPSFQPEPIYESDYESSYQSWDETLDKPKTGMAIFSLVLGIIGFFTLGVLGVGAVVGIIVAAVAMSRAKNSPWKYGGRSIAVAGLILNILALVSVVPVGMIAAIAIPNLMAARVAANEGSAIHSLRILANAENVHQATDGTFGSLDQMAAKKLIDPLLGNGAKNGYRFTVDIRPASEFIPAGFDITATPLTYNSSGRRTFFIDETGVVRGGDSRGGLITKEQAEPLGTTYEESPMRRPQKVNSRQSGF